MDFSWTHSSIDLPEFFGPVILGKRLKDWRKKEECNAPIVALTATAVNGGDFDSVSEIIEMLDLQIYPEDVLLSCIKRENIEINISKFEQDTSKSKKRSFVIEKIKGLKNTAPLN